MVKRIAMSMVEGQAVSRSTYAGLFSQIGTTFGAGDGSTTFNLPDGRGRALIGVGTGTGLTARALGASGGAETHQLTEAQMPSHTHTTTRLFYWERGTGGMAGYSAGSVMDRDPVATNTKGSDQAHNNMQPWLAANLFIFAGV